MGGRVEDTDTVFFIHKDKNSKDRQKDIITYGKCVYTIQQNKAKLNRTQLTSGGNLINYPDDYGIPTGDMLLVKILLNSVISTDSAKIMTGDIKNFTPTYYSNDLNMSTSNSPIFQRK